MRIILSCLLLVLTYSLPAQTATSPIEVTGSRKAVRTSGDILMLLTPAASLAATLALQDWEGLKQGALTGVTAIGTTIILKQLIDKERPDGSDNDSFPSMHATVSFAGAAFLQKRYGWTYGIPAYLLSAYVGWSRVYGKKHDWWDVAAGTAIGIGSGYIFTHPYAKKHHLTITPVAGGGHIGLHASMVF